MRLATLKVGGAETAAVITSGGAVLVSTINEAKGTDYATDMMSLIKKGQIPQMNDWYRAGGKAELENMKTIPAAEMVYGPLYRNPARIFGIGLNYADHASDIGSAAPKGFPGSFFKQADTLIGPGDAHPPAPPQGGPEDHCRGRAGHHPGPGLPGRARGGLGEGGGRLHHHPGYDRGVHPERQRLCGRQPPVPHHRQELPHLLQLRASSWSPPTRCPRT